MSWRALQFMILALLSLLGCASHRRVRGPDAVLETYISAVQAGDAAAVYAMLDQGTREEVTLAQFRKLFRENRSELLQQSRELSRQIPQNIETRARVPLGSREQTVLVLERDRWYVEGGILGAPVLKTPREAVLSLRNAIRRKSFHEVERVLASELRAELQDELGRFLEDTEDELDLAYEVHGNQARVRTRGGLQILLVREAGEWRILDVE